jgi:hypothetical protein
VEVEVELGDHQVIYQILVVLEVVVELKAVNQVLVETLLLLVLLKEITAAVVSIMVLILRELVVEEAEVLQLMERVFRHLTQTN